MVGTPEHYNLESIASNVTNTYDAYVICQLVSGALDKAAADSSNIDQSFTIKSIRYDSVRREYRIEVEVQGTITEVFGVKAGEEGQEILYEDQQIYCSSLPDSNRYEITIFKSHLRVLPDEIFITIGDDSFPIFLNNTITVDQDRSSELLDLQNTEGELDILVHNLDKMLSALQKRASEAPPMDSNSPVTINTETKKAGEWKAIIQNDISRIKELNQIFLSKDLPHLVNASRVIRAEKAIGYIRE